MVRTSRWSLDARRQFLRWFIDFAEQDETLARKAADLIEARAEKAARRPYDGRPSRWPGLREASLKRWHKLLVYEVTDTEAVIIAFYDMRQDLSVVSPTPE